MHLNEKQPQMRTLCQAAGAGSAQPGQLLSVTLSVCRGRRRGAHDVLRLPGQR